MAIARNKGMRTIGRVSVTLLFGLVFALPALGDADVLPVKIECDTGGMARVHTPVSAELRFGKDVPESARGWFADAGKADVVLRRDGKEIPAQLESLVDENNQVCGARISWIIESAAARKTLS